MPARQTPDVQYSHSVLVGRTEEANVAGLVRREFEGAWGALTYRVLARNCNEFTAALAHRLTGKRPPAYLNRLARWTPACVAPMLEPPAAEGAADGVTREETQRLVAPAPVAFGGQGRRLGE